MKLLLELLMKTNYFLQADKSNYFEHINKISSKLCVFVPKYPRMSADSSVSLVAERITFKIISIWDVEIVGVLELCAHGHCISFQNEDYVFSLLISLPSC